MAKSKKKSSFKEDIVGSLNAIYLIIDSIHERVIHLEAIESLYNSTLAAQLTADKECAIQRARADKAENELASLKAVRNRPLSGFGDKHTYRPSDPTHLESDCAECGWRSYDTNHKRACVCGHSWEGHFRVRTANQNEDCEKCPCTNYRPAEDK